MQKHLLLTLLAVLTTALPALAYDFQADGIYYNILSEEDLTCEVTRGDTKYSGDIIIPSTITYNEKTYSVTSIGEYAFSNCSSLTSVQIPNSVTSIGSRAFFYCSSLTSAEIPNSVTSIGIEAFYGCSSLTSIEIPNSVTSIGGGAFGSCTSLESFTGKYATNDHRCLIVDDVFISAAPVGLTTYSIPSSVTSIGRAAFRECKSLTSIEIPNSVTSIEQFAFDCCTSLTSVEIPNSVTSIELGAFAFCTSLTSIEIPSSVTAISLYAFYNCSSLTSVIIPNSVTAIEDTAFGYCTSLTSVNIPNSVTSIEQNAFSSCSSLTQITSLAVTPPTIDSDTFYGVPKTEALVKVPAESVEAYKSAAYWSEFTNIEPISNNFEKDGIYYNVLSWQDLTCEVTNNGDGSYSGDITIPTTVTYSGETFTVTSIGMEEFEECTNLTSVQIPNTVTSIGTHAFHGCSSLTSLEIPNSVTEIGDWAFQYCTGLTSVEIPSSVTTMGKRVFGSCFNMTSFYGKFASDDHRCLVVDGVLNSFAPAGLTTYCIPNSVIMIGFGAFYQYTDLTSVKFPKSVTEIGEHAFEDCFGLTSLVIPNSVTKIGEYAFACNYHNNKSESKLASVVIGNSVTEIGDCAFYKCTSLTSLVIGDSVSSIGDCAFERCSSLTSVTIPNSATSIGVRAFDNCSSLTSVEIPNSVTSIGREAFFDCTSLTEITSLAVTPPTIESNTFKGVPTTEAILKVPAESVEAYKSAEYWSDFTNIVPFTKGQCATPEISIADGKIIVTSETEGSTCHTAITTDDYKETDTNDPIEVTGIYNISAYAHADGYTNSETAYATLVWVMPEGDATGLLCMEAKKPVIIRSLGGNIVIIGTEKLEKIQLYTIAGVQLASVTADGDQTTIPCSVPKGDVVIVKYGNRSVKIVM